jgi:hypothetical protein
MLDPNQNVIDLGTCYRLIGFDPPYRRFLVGLIGAYEVRGIVIYDAIYVPWCDIEPHSSLGTDEEELTNCFTRKSLPIYDPVGLFEDINAARAEFISKERHRLSITLRNGPHSAARKNPFADSVDFHSVWRDIVLVACHETSQRNSSRLMAAYESFLISCAKGDADSVGLPQFFRSLLDAAEVGCASGSDPFDDLWGMLGFAMPCATGHSFSVARSLFLLVRAAHGWRGDPHGSVRPGTLMDECVRILQPTGERALMARANPFATTKAPTRS